MTSDYGQTGPGHDNVAPPGPPCGPLIALLLVIALAPALLFVMHWLDQEGQMQDCFAFGRTNCAPINTQ